MSWLKSSGSSPEAHRVPRVSKPPSSRLALAFAISQGQPNSRVGPWAPHLNGTNHICILEVWLGKREEAMGHIGEHCRFPGNCCPHLIFFFACLFIGRTRFYCTVSYLNLRNAGMTHAPPCSHDINELRRLHRVSHLCLCTVRFQT